MFLQCLGASQEVTGSCFLIKVANHQILVDCGLIQGSHKQELRNQEPFSFNPSEIDAVILSHAHIDHSGRLPLLVKQGFSGKIYTHFATKDLCQIMLLDAANLNEKDIEFENKKRQRKNLPPLEPLYTVHDATAAIQQFESIDYQKIISVTPSIRLRLQDAGHILGAGLIELWINEKGVERKLVFSGDLGRKNMPILCDPELIREADMVIMESTYGDRTLPAWAETVNQFCDLIKEAGQSGGNILIPTFAIGRSQEILYTLNQNFQRCNLQNKIIFLDSPMAIEATKVYAKYWTLYDKEAKELVKKTGSPYQLPNLRICQSTEESIKINQIVQGAIILAGSGMCDGGRIRHHLKHNLWKRQSHIIFVGYQAQGTLGRLLLDGVKEVKLWGERITVAAKIHSIFGFSAHADQDALLDWYGHFESLPPLILVHGEIPAMETLKQKLYERYTIHAFTPKFNTVFDLIKRKPVEIMPEPIIMGPQFSPPALNYLKPKRVGIDTYSEPIIYLNDDNIVCHAEGLSALSRVNVNTLQKSITATLNVVKDHFLNANEVGLSEVAWQMLELKGDEMITLSHAKPVDSFSFVRKKLFGSKLCLNEMQDIVQDIVAGRYSQIQLSAFISACTSNELDLDELVSLTQAMVNTGDTLSWPNKIVMDKHCIGGLPGNRTTPIIVAIVTACGLLMPKTSSRAITSPAGTADTMEVIAPVNLTLQQMQAVVEQEGGCLVWGGSVNLSPADDLLIQVERVLDLDSEGQMVPSIISKKLAAGATHVLIDIPVGATTKIRSQVLAEHLAEKLINVGRNLNLNIYPVITDGNQPVGRGIGPALEMSDIMDVLSNSPQAPKDLRERSLMLTGKILEMANYCQPGQGQTIATQILDSGQALKKFLAIAVAQGGLHEIPHAKFKYEVLSQKAGLITYFNNRFLARLAKFAGAPLDKAAGIYLNVKLGDKISAQQPLFTIYSESEGQLNYVLEFMQGRPEAIRIEDERL